MIATGDDDDGNGATGNMTMVMARWATARQDTTMTRMATGDDDNNDGDSATA